MGSWSQAFHANDVIYRMQCFVKYYVLERITPYMFISHTKMLIVFRTGWSRIILLESLPNTQSSCLFLQEDKWAVYEFKLWRHRHKSMTSDLKTKYYAETNTSDVEKTKNRHKQNFEGEANIMQLDKEDPQWSNLNSEYLSATLVLKYPRWFFYLFLLCSISLLVKYDLILWFKAQAITLNCTG